MRARWKTEQVGAGNTDPFNNKALVKAKRTYTNAESATTEKITPFPRKRQSLRRRASVRLAEMYRLALFRRHHGLSVEPNTFAFALAATLECGRPGTSLIRGRVNHETRQEARPHLIDWPGLNMPSLKEAIRKADLGAFSDDELATIIAAVERFTGENGVALIGAARLGAMLQLTSAERQECRIRTVDAVDEPRAERIARLKDEKRVRDREEKRAKRGRVPRSVYEQRSLSRTKPWEAKGVSRATWYRKLRETGVSADDISNTRSDTLVSRYGSLPIHTVPGPARSGGASQSDGAGGHSPSGRTIKGEASRSDGAAALGWSDGEVGVLTPRPRIADPGEPPLPELTGRTAAVVALMEAAADIIMVMPDRLLDPDGTTLRGVRDALEISSDLLWMADETDPDGADETARITARMAADLLRMAAANDNRLSTIAQRLAA